MYNIWEFIKNKGYIFVIIASLIWSFDGILRINLYTLPPAVVVFYEHLFGLIILLPLFYKWSKDLKKMSRKEWLAIIIVALLSGALGTIFYTAALGQVKYIQYSIVVLLQQLEPIWAILAASIILKEKISKQFLFWAALALISAYLITFKDLTFNFNTGNGTLIAGLLALSAGIFWGTSTAISKYVLNKVSFLTATALRFLFTPFFAFIIILSSKQTAQLFTLTHQHIVNLIVIVFSTGLVALAIYYFGLKKSSARVTTICELTWPASAILIDYFYFHKSLSLTQMLGIALLLFSIHKITTYKNNV